MRIGVIGCGEVARQGHLPALRSLNEVDVVAVADIDSEIAKKVAKSFNIPSHYKDYRLMLTHEDVDTVVIATPTPTHATIAVEVAQAEKNIVIEKPLAASLSECSSIKKAVEDNNIKLSIVQNFRYFPSFKASRCRLSQGNLGKVVTFYGVAQTRYPTSWTKGQWLYHKKGELLDFAPHLVDASLWLMGTSARAVYAYGGNFTEFSDFIDHANILVELENGAAGFLETSWLTNSFAFSINIKGTGGLLKIDALYDYYEELHGLQTPLDDAKHFTNRMMKIIKGVLTGDVFDKSMRAYTNVYKDIIEGFKEGLIPIPIEEGIKSLAVLDAAYLSIKERRAVDIEELLEIQT